MIFLPDRYLARFVAERTDVEIVTWEGACEVHERFTGEDIARFRRGYDDLTVIAHPECPDGVQDAADFVGSTAEMIRFARERRPSRLLMLTECSMSDNLVAELPRRAARAPVQSLPAHEADHAAEDPALARRPWSPGSSSTPSSPPAPGARSTRMLAVGG